MSLLKSWKTQAVGAAVCTALLALSSGCSQSNSPTAQSSTTASSPAASNQAASNVKFDQQILSDFADKVVVPTNLLFAKKAEELSTAIDNFVKIPNDNSLKAAQDAWVAARSPWEQSECFGFGPAKSLGYDGALDTWPVNQTDLKKVLDSKEKITPESIEKRQETEKGFHVIEYLLFGEGKTRKAFDLGKQELDYLQAIGKDFSKVAGLLANSWSKGVEGKPAYREVIAKAGDSSNTIYPTVQAGTQEMLGGMLDSLDEVANKKIGKTFEAKDAKLAESRFSFNTLTDIKHNVQGSENVYLGSFKDANTSGMGLSAYVAKVKPDLDARVKKEFDAAQEALNKIPEPFEKAIADPKAADAIKAAQAAVNAVHETLEKEVKPLFNS